MQVSQSLPHPGTVSVFGSYVVRASPDLAVITFDVSRVSAEPAEAFAETKIATTLVREFLKASKIQSADVQTTRTILELATSGYGNDHKVLGHRAKLSFSVTLRELDEIELILVGVIESGAHSISGVRFETSKLVALRADARRGAVAAARKKAELYADAAGVALGKVQHIEDVNPESNRYHGHGADADAADFDEESGSASAGAMTVSAAVMLAFAIV